jgi:transketolase
VLPTAFGAKIVDLDDAAARAVPEWAACFEAWSAARPGLAAEWRTAHSGALPDNWEAALPTFTPKEDMATRKSGGITAISCAPWRSSSPLCA